MWIQKNKLATFALHNLTPLKRKWEPLLSHLERDKTMKTKHNHRYDYSVLIGRFQPVHNEHLKLIRTALHGSESAKKLLIVLGSHRSAPNFRNPWSTEHREEMIRLCLTPEENQRVDFIPVRDQLYNDTLWCAEIQQKVKEVIPEDAKVSLTGNHKDDTSFYIHMFPQWKWTGDYLNNDFGGATAIRQSFFGGEHHTVKDWMLYVPPAVVEYLETYKDICEDYQNIAAERSYLDRYPKEEKRFPRINVTTDCVVMCSGHVLVVRRGFNPGKGQLALPGGFVNVNEIIVDSAVRELYEETKILYDRHVIKDRIVDSKVFDHPQRSLRGRIITHAYFIRLEPGPLPRVKGGDDAKEAMWMPIADLYLKEPEFFEDHLHIINHFINKG